MSKFFLFLQRSLYIIFVYCIMLFANNYLTNVNSNNKINTFINHNNSHALFYRL